MTFLSLFDKLGKQPIHNVRKSELKVILSYEDLEKLIEQKQSSYEIPLTLKFSNSGQTLYFSKK